MHSTEWLFVLYFYQVIHTTTGVKKMALNIHKILANTLLDLCREKKLEAITIKDILEETGISRQTFYNRFRDKNDLIQWTYENMVLSEFHKSGETGSYYENTVAYCKALEKYRFFMKQAYQLEGQNNLRDWIYDYATEYDYNWHCQQMGVDSMSDEFAYISRYHSIATINMEMEWICSRDKERMSPEEIARRITKIRRISMSDKFFGPYNTVYEFPDETEH
jgi:AcrR family transcriptional regulator